MRDNMKISEIFIECHFEFEGKDVDVDVQGYHFADFFSLEVSREVSSREESLNLLRCNYKGPDVDGVGVWIPEA